jgi:hypothetical protein
MRFPNPAGRSCSLPDTAAAEIMSVFAKVRNLSGPDEDVVARRKSRRIPQCPVPDSGTHILPAREPDALKIAFACEYISD